MSGRDYSYHQPSNQSFFNVPTAASPSQNSFQHSNEVPRPRQMSHHVNQRSISSAGSLGASPEYPVLRSLGAESTVTLVNPFDSPPSAVQPLHPSAQSQARSRRPADLHLSQSAYRKESTGGESMHSFVSRTSSNYQYPQEAYSLPPSQSLESYPLVEPNSTAYNPRRGSVISTSAPTRGHPFWPQTFEQPLYLRFLLHVGLCALAFPIVYIIPVIRPFQGIPLFWARAVAGACCSVAGLILGLSLLQMARPGLEAAVWATIIHESMVGDQGGITLDEYRSYCYDPESPMTALTLLYRRWRHHQGAARKNRNYDRFPWTFTILFFLALVGTAASLPFIFSRVVIITTRPSHQTKQFSQTQVMGDLSTADIANAAKLTDTFNKFALTWTLSPYIEAANLPKPVLMPNPHEPTEKIYFAEAYVSQLTTNATGFGTFTLTDDDHDANFAPISEDDIPAMAPGSVGSIVRWPRWGARLKCDYLPDMATNLIPVSPAGNTFAFIPRDTVAKLVTALGLPVPDYNDLPNSVDMSTLATGLDAPLATRNTTGIAYVGVYSPTGLAASFYSQPLSMGEDGKGWLEMEALLIRLNKTYTPQGTFGLENVAADGTRIGYDMMICVEAIEPWVLDVYNVTGGAPKTVDGVIHGGNAANGWGTTVANDTMSFTLNSTNKAPAYIAAHDNSRNTIIKDNGKDVTYVPSPTVVAFSGNSGPDGYTRIAPDDVEDILGRADAVQLLPYLTGSQSILAFSYPDRILAYCAVDWLILVAAISFTLVLGFIAAFFIPKLPLGIPRRDFGLFSWIAESDRLMDPEKAKRGASLYDRKHLDEVKGELGSKKIRLM